MILKIQPCEILSNRDDKGCVGRYFELSIKGISNVYFIEVLTEFE